jgi:DNA-binding transcriptional LysR family regulator
MEEEIYLAVPLDHPLSKRTDILLNEVANDYFISLGPGQSLREMTDGFCKDAGFIPKIAFQSDDPATVRGLIQARQGIAFIPSITWGGVEDTSLSLLRIQAPICKRIITLSHTIDRYLPQNARLFRQFAIDFFRHKKTHAMKSFPVRQGDV